LTTRREALIVGAVFLGLALAWGVASTAFQEADDVTHYAISRWIFRYPFKLVDIWGRPFITAFYALPAQLGPTTARLASILLGVVTAWSAARIFKKGGGVQTALAVACTLGMPALFTQLYGILTELGFAAVLGAGFALYREWRPRPPALVWSLLPLARPEGFFLAPFLGLVFLAVPSAHGSRPFSLARFANGALLLAGTGAWWLGGLPVYRRPGWMVEEWPRNWKVDSVYGDGHPLLFFGFLVVVTTHLLFPFFVLGAVRFWKARLRLEIAVVGFVVLLHTVLRTFGLFGSAGYPRYLVTVAPLLGALSAKGIETVVEAWTRRDARLLGARSRAAIAGLLTAALVAVILATPHSGPVRGDRDSQLMRAIWPWCERQLAKDPKLRFVADHPFFFIPGDLDRGRNGIPFLPHVIEYAEIGAIAIWETKFAWRYSKIEHEDLAALGFDPVPKAEVAGPGPYPWEAAAPASGDPELADFEWQVFVKRR
jgi:hypothetical protein